MKTIPTRARFFLKKSCGRILVTSLVLTGLLASFLILVPSLGSAATNSSDKNTSSRSLIRAKLPKPKHQPTQNFSNAPKVYNYGSQNDTPKFYADLKLLDAAPIAPVAAISKFEILTSKELQAKAFSRAYSQMAQLLENNAQLLDLARVEKVIQGNSLQLLNKLQGVYGEEVFSREFKHTLTQNFNNPAWDAVAADGSLVKYQYKTNLEPTLADLEKWLYEMDKASPVKPGAKPNAVVLTQDGYNYLKTHSQGKKLDQLLSEGRVLVSKYSTIDFRNAMKGFLDYADETMKGKNVDLKVKQVIEHLGSQNVNTKFANALASGELKTVAQSEGIVQKLWNFLSGKFANVAKYAGSFAKALAPFAKVGAGILGVVGIIFGLLQTGISGSDVLRILQQEGPGKLFTSREGWVAMLKTLAGALTAISGGAAVAAVATSWTGIGGLSAGAIALLAGALALALEGVALGIEHWDDITNLANKGIKFLHQGFDTLVKKAGEAWEIAKNSVKGAAAGAQLVLGRAKTILDNATNVIVKAGSAVVKKMVDVAYTIKGKVKQTVPKVVEYVEKVSRDVVKQGKRIVEEIIEKPKQILETVWQTGKRIVEKTKEVIKQVPRTVYDTAKRVVEKIVPVVKTVYDTVKETAYRTVERAKQVVHKVKEDVVQTGLKWVNQVREVVREVPRKVYETATRVVEKIVPVVKTVYDTVKETAYRFVNKTKQVVKNVVETVMKPVNTVVNEVRRVAKTVWKTVTEWVPQTVKSWVGRFLRAVTKWVPIVKQVAQTVYENVIVPVTKVIYTPVRVVKQVVETITERVREPYEVVKRVARQVVENVKQKFTETYQVVKTVYDKVKEKIVEKVQVPYQYVTTVVKNVKGWVTEKVQEAYEVVRQVPRKVVEYVKEKTEETFQTARTVYDTVKEQVKEQVEETYQFATQVPKTIIEKVKQTKEEAYEYVERVVDNVIKQKTVQETVEVEQDVPIVRKEWKWVEEPIALGATPQATLVSKNISFNFNPGLYSVGASTPAFVMDGDKLRAGDPLVDGLKKFAGGVVDVFNQGRQAIADGIDYVGNKAGEAKDWAENQYKGASNKVFGTLENVAPDFVKGTVRSTKELADTSVGFVSGGLDAVGGMVGGLTKAVVKPEDAIKGIGKFAVDTWNDGSKFVNDLAKDPKSTLGAVVDNSYQSLKDWSEKPAFERGEDTGKLTVEVGTLFIGGAGVAGKVGKAGSNGSKAAGFIDDAGKVGVKYGDDALKAAGKKVGGKVDDAAKAGASQAGDIATSGIKKLEKIGEIDSAISPDTAKIIGGLSNKGTITVYRVEGIPNTKILINQEGNVRIIAKKKTLYLNFGDKNRAAAYLKQKIEKDMPGVRAKSFEVPESFLDELSRDAVDQSLARNFPDRPIRVDVTKAENQFGLTRKQIAALRENVVKNSGKDVTDELLEIFDELD